MVRERLGRTSIFAVPAVRDVHRPRRSLHSIRDCEWQEEDTMAEIQVTAWGTREPLPNDRAAVIHDCLWEIAQEQATLEKMKQDSASWDAASPKVSQQDIRKHLDTICDDNGFRRLDGSGSGRDPNLIHTGERITVRIDPKQLDQPAKGVDTKPSQDAYSKVVASEDGQGPDLNKKEAVDKWLETVPGFGTTNLSEHTKAALITAYDTPGINRENLAKLGGSAAFLSLDEKQQQQLLAVYGTEGKSFATGEVDKVVASSPGEEANKRLKVFGSQGFFKMDEGAQKTVAERYTNDQQFRGAIDQIAGQQNFTEKNSTEQAHALDVLGRYSGRKGEGYGEQPEGKRTSVLVTLYNEVLSKPEFNLNEYGKSDKPENDSQKKALDNFAENRASEIGGTKEPEPKATERDYGHTD
jgi:hypothetical protein